MSKLKCLIITPFDFSGQRIYDTIRRSLEKLDIQILKIDDQPSAALMTNSIVNSIKTADFIVVDISRSNPNVMYELGYAHAIQKSTIIITSNDSISVPTDLLGYLYIIYDKENLRSLQKQITASALEFVEGRRG